MQPKVNYTIQVLPFGHFVFRQILGPLEEEAEGKLPQPPYQFPVGTAPEKRIRWFLEE